VKRREYENAIADFTEAIKLSPGFTETYFERAMVYLRMDEMDAALEDFDKISELK